MKIEIVPQVESFNFLVPISIRIAPHYIEIFKKLSQTVDRFVQVSKKKKLSTREKICLVRYPALYHNSTCFSAEGKVVPCRPSKFLIHRCFNKPFLIKDSF